jgi:hypothetical protein
MKNLCKRNIAIFLTLLFAISTFLVPSNADAASTKATYAFVDAMPNPVNAGAQTLVHFGITEPIGTAQDGWKDLTVVVTAPDGTNETLGPFKTDSTGATATNYVPDTSGNYTLQTFFPQQDWSGVTYKASSSDPLTLKVVDSTVETVAQYPAVPLPTEYWTRPIDAQARDWYTISGSWLMTPDNKYAPYNDGPETAHILWTTPLTTGGLAGGDLGLVGSAATSVGMETGDAYEGKWSNRIILNGKLYYNVGPYTMPNTIHCVDLHTGEELWAKTFLDNRSISFGQLMYFQSYNYQGTFAYLWVTTGGAGMFGMGAPTPENWYAFDPNTGDWVATINNVPAGTTVYGRNGDIYRYVVNQQQGWAALWNMTSLVVAPDAGSWGSAFSLKTFDASAKNATTGQLMPTAQRAYTWNVTIPKGLPGSVISGFLDDRIIGSNIASIPLWATTPQQCVVWGINTKKGQEGQLLFNNTLDSSTWIAGNQTVYWVNTGGQSAFDAGDKIGVIQSKELTSFYGISFETGKMIWGPSKSETYLDAYGDQLTTRQIAYHNLYTVGVAGVLRAYNVNTGELVWSYAIDDPYTESLASNNWWSGIMFITDGKIYVGSSEHSANQPLPRGAPFVCLNATDGSVIWRANGLFRQTDWGGMAIIGDSIIATMDTYDQRIYAIGKGPTETAISANPKVTTYGSSIQIEGTITDISPGTEDAALALRFPNGVPAVSDKSQSDWMLYVYKQFPTPSNVTGVPVTLSVVDSNGNYRTIGSTTTTADGFFSFNWKPDIEGQYTIYAFFAGSEAYWPSHDVTSFAVEPAAATASPQSTVAPSMADLYFLPAIAGLFVAIIICIAMVALVLRKKP